MRFHAGGHRLLIRVCFAIQDLTHFIMSHQFLEDLLLVLERMLAETRLIGNQASHCLRVSPRDQRVIQQVIVVILGWVLKVELDQLNAIRKGVQRHFNTLQNCNKVIFFNFTCMCMEDSNGKQGPSQSLVII